MSETPQATDTRTKRRRSFLNAILLLAAILFFAAGLYLLIRPILTRHKQEEVRQDLLANMDEGRFEPIYVDPNAWVDPDEEVQYFIPDGSGGYITVTGDPEDIKPSRGDGSDKGNRRDDGAIGVEVSLSFGDGERPGYEVGEGGGLGQGRPDDPRLSHALTPLARLVIPKIAVDIPVVEGLNSVNLRYAACHYEETAAIGSVGSAAIFAHRSPLHGRDLNRLNEVQAGDRFTLETETEILTYRVERNIVTAPAGVFEHFYAPVSVSRVILVTCHPIPSWENRMLVIAKLESREARSD
ncbi:MAG: sortase [Bacillota bacterium]|nr:sortase [Bacillota bacterium]